MMPQYGDYFSIYICIVAALPSALLCMLGKKNKVINILASLVVITTILGLHTLQFIEFAGFLLFELLLVYGYFAFRKRCTAEFAYFVIFLLSLCPIVAVRIGEHTAFATFIGFTGISYMCFKIWQLLFEIHDGKIKELNILDVLSFLIFAPSFSSGPISRYQQHITEYEENAGLEAYLTQYLPTAAKKIVIGIFYKFVLATGISSYVMQKISQEANLKNIAVYMYAYTFYLFFDFAGYSSMAVGFGSLMGIKLPENFNKPFLARNMKEFWERWHMSLSTWFNDYVFGRFVLNNIRNGLFKNPRFAARCAYMVTMLIMGLWHGLHWNYIWYGLYQGTALVLTDIYVSSKFYRQVKKKPYYDWISRGVCFQIIAVGLLIFSGHF